MKTSKVDAAEIVAIQKLAEGDVNRFFDDAIQRAVLNCLDPKTSWATKRGLVLRFKFKPDENRNQVAIAISCTPKIAGQKPKTTRIMVGKRKGQVAAAEHQRVVDPVDQPVEYDESGYDNVASYISLASLGGGVIPERWTMAMEAVAQNILDVNTDPCEVRGIAITVTFKPDEGRSMANGHIDIDVKLAPYKSIPFSLNFEDGEGTTIKVTEHRREQLKLPV